MKKTDLLLACFFFLFGLGSCTYTVLSSQGADFAFRGSAQCSFMAGLGCVWHYLWWTTEKHQKEYRRKLEEKGVIPNDGFLRQVRDRAAYIAFAVTVSVTVLAIAVLISLYGLPQLPDVSLALLLLCALLAVELLAGAFAYALTLRHFS